MDRNRAVNQSLESVMGPLNVNIGINSGSALVTRMTFTATGTVTNIAARLSDFAKGGDILMGEQTKKMVGGLWPVYPLGPARLKEVKDPLPVFSLLRAP
ncbi:MAG: hypothetical protein KAH62_00120 [Desulfobacula sp.]|nr:hypothetical protein [Desulfobacula sp.]